MVVLETETGTGYYGGRNEGWDMVGVGWTRAMMQRSAVRQGVCPCACVCVCVVIGGDYRELHM